MHYSQDNIEWVFTKYGRGCIYSPFINVYVISSIFVHTGYRKQGYGTKLLKKLEHKCFKHKVKSIFLFVKANSFMYKWYENNGYKYHSDFRDDLVWMQKCC